MSIYQAIKNFHTQFEFEPKIENSGGLGEYEKYRQEQDKDYISDFDREVKKILKSKKK